MPVNVQLDALALDEVVHEGANTLGLRLRALRGTTVGLSTRVGGGAAASPLVRPVTVDIGALAVVSVVGRSVLAPEAVARGVDET